MSTASKVHLLRTRPEQGHFNARVRERLWPLIGPIDPAKLFEILQEHIEIGHPDLSYVTRISRDGKRLWRVDFPPIHFYAVVRHYEGRIYPMTVLLPGMKVGREGKSVITLR